MSLAEAGTHVLVAALHFAAERVRRARFLTTRIWHPRVEMRVSFSALLCACEGGRYLLVRNRYRPELFGPFGGVYKYRRQAKRYLDEVLWRSQDYDPGHDMRNDLRGFLPRRNLTKLVKWFERGDDREKESECLRRELLEEITEVGLRKELSIPTALRVRLVRKVTEGPEKVPGYHYTQFRIYEIWEPDEDDSKVRDLLASLFRTAAHHKDLLVANSDEIVKGRARDGRHIGNHCTYLIGGKRLRPEAPPFPS